MCADSRLEDLEDALDAHEANRAVRLRTSRSCVSSKRKTAQCRGKTAIDVAETPPVKELLR